MNMKRMRGRNHRPGGGGGGGGGGGFRNQQNGIPLNRNHVFDSSGPEMRVRGTAQQLFDKYTQLARDASSSGDRVLGEAYYQHAEHYFRIISAINQAQGVPNQPQNGQQGSFAHGEGDSEQPHQRQEPRQERSERQDRQEYRERQENRENRGGGGENRDQNRGENRGERQERRFEQRPRPDFQQRDRGERPFRQPQPPIADAPIDISSALEAELAAAQPPGMSEQPAIQHELAMPAPAAREHPARAKIEPEAKPAAEDKPESEAASPAPAPEPRAIPISPAAPPPAEAEEAAAPVRRSRGRPRLVKADTPSE